MTRTGIRRTVRPRITWTPRRGTPGANATSNTRTFTSLCRRWRLIRIRPTVGPLPNAAGRAAPGGLAVRWLLVEWDYTLGIWNPRGSFRSRAAAESEIARRESADCYVKKPQRHAPGNSP